jgi:hypothetical protein
VLYGAVAAALAVILGVVGVVAFSGGDDADEPLATATPEATAEPPNTPTDEPEPTPTPTAVPTAEPAVATPALVAPTPATGASPVGGPIVLGDAVTGALAAGEVARHTFQATAGEVIRFEVTSPDGDPRIFMNTPNSIPVVGAT